MSQDNPLLEKANNYASGIVKEYNLPPAKSLWIANMIYKGYLAGHAEGASSSVNGGVWVDASNPPKEKGFYNVRGLNNQGNPVDHTDKDKIWFTGTFWVIREGCKVTEWYCESRPSLPKDNGGEVTESHFSDTLDSIIKGQLEKARERVKELEDALRKIQRYYPPDEMPWDNHLFTMRTIAQQALAGK